MYMTKDPVYVSSGSNTYYQYWPRLWVKYTIDNLMRNVKDKGKKFNPNNSQYSRFIVSVLNLLPSSS